MTRAQLIQLASDHRLMIGFEFIPRGPGYAIMWPLYVDSAAVFVRADRARPSCDMGPGLC